MVTIVQEQLIQMILWPLVESVRVLSDEIKTLNFIAKRK